MLLPYKGCNGGILSYHFTSGRPLVDDVTAPITMPGKTVVKFQDLEHVYINQH